MEKVMLSDLPKVARKVLDLVPKEGYKAALVVLRGDLGAGKTTFVQALAHELGVDDVVQSPTYVLMKSYPIVFGRFKRLVHIDAYRLTTPQEFKTLKPEDFLDDSFALVVLEWPERVEGQLGTPDITIDFSSKDMPIYERFIEIS